MEKMPLACTCIAKLCFLLECHFYVTVPILAHPKLSRDITPIIDDFNALFNNARSEDSGHWATKDPRSIYADSEDSGQLATNGPMTAKTLASGQLRTHTSFRLTSNTLIRLIWCLGWSTSFPAHSHVFGSRTLGSAVCFFFAISGNHWKPQNRFV